MSISKSCLRCSAPLPADSVAELCPACTSNARASETPGPPTPTPIHETLTQIPRAQDAPTISRDDNDGISGIPTDVAAAAVGFATDQAGTNARPTPNSAGPPAKPFPVISRYRILDRLGEGGAGEVFLARQVATSRDVAIKVLNSPRTSDRQRFDREALHLGKLNHPAIVNVHDVGDSDRGPYICMELMPGGSLAQRLKDEGPLPEREAARLMEQIARGLAVVHDAGILHRDLKPGNILLDKHGLPKIADFGLAKSAVIDAAHSLDGITQPGVMGTPSYMALEQAEARHEDVTKLTDVYGLGAILYHMLTGKPPYGGKTAWEIVNKVMRERPRDPSSLRPGLDPTLEAICLKCMEKQPEKRYQGALEFADDLARWQHGDSTIARPASRGQKLVRWLGRQRRIAAVAVLVLAAAVTINLAGLWLKPKPVVVAEEDPDKELKKIREEIATGNEVTLIGETGLPRWYDKKNSEVIFRESTYGDSPTHFHATKDEIVQLLREEDMPEFYKVTAEIRHEKANSETSMAGISMGSVNILSPFGAKRTYANRIVFNDDSFKNMPDFPNAEFFLCCIDIYNFGQGMIAREKAICSKKITSPDFTKQRPWRKLNVQVNSTSVEIGLPEDKIRYEPQKTITLEEIARKNTELHKLFLPTEPIPDKIISRPLRGALLLITREGAASFKNVTIQKISR